MPNGLLIEGWRAIHHSYALVAQAHALCLLDRPEITLRFRDLPYYYDTWRRTRGLYDVNDEARIAAIPTPEADFAPDATWSMHAERPDFSATRSGRKFVFGTPEHRVLRRENLGKWHSAADVAPTVEVITPSSWTAFAYLRFGFDPARVHVVPHGIDPRVVHPDDTRRAALRDRLGLRDGFVFMSVGAMTPNKGIDRLLQAFAVVAQGTPEVRLLLKGADGLYPSQEYLKHALAGLAASAREHVAQRLSYHGGTLSAHDMADFLRTADCYVAPYLAEGFNMPVLEAAGCGAAVICTSGGPTDEFTLPSFATRIRSRIVSIPLNEAQHGDVLAPDLDHLIDCMRDAVRDPERTRERGQAGARHVAAHYTWKLATDRLVKVLFPAQT